MPQSESLPLVTTIIPVYNRSWELLRAIQSALAQSIVEQEIIVVDDGSDSPIAPLVAHLRDDRVRVIRLGTNGGVASARNAALDEARGQFVAFLDSDDEWHPQKLELQLRAARAHPDAGAVLCSFRVGECGRVGRPLAAPAGDVGRYLSLHAGPTIASCILLTPAHRRQELRFDARLVTLEDLDLVIQVVTQSAVASVPKVLVNKGVSPSRLYSGRSVVNGRLALLEKYFEHIRSVPDLHARYLWRCAADLEALGDSDAARNVMGHAAVAGDLSRSGSLIKLAYSFRPDLLPATARIVTWTQRLLSRAEFTRRNLALAISRRSVMCRSL